MSLRDSVQVALLLAVGYVLRVIVPGYVAGMKPDPMMGMLIVIILIHRKVRVSLLAGSIAGIIGALTITFPGGQIPYLIDKIITSLVLFGLSVIVVTPLEQLLSKSSVRVMGKKAALGTVLGCVITGITGTLFSGVIFLSLALYMVGLPAPFTVLFSTVVIPATLANTIVVIILYPLVSLARRIVGGPVNLAEETAK